MNETEDYSEHARFVTSDSGHSTSEEEESTKALSYDQAIRLVCGMPLKEDPFELDPDEPRLSTNLDNEPK